jgi:hypothetical protein
MNIPPPMFRPTPLEMLTDSVPKTAKLIVRVDTKYLEDYYKSIREDRCSCEYTLDFILELICQIVTRANTHFLT